jgi:hypothetical protein
VTTHLRVIERPDDLNIADGIPPAGSMWRFPDGDREGRECWCVVLPNAAGIWQTTEHSSEPGNNRYGTGPMWEVTGEPPNITVNPSIDSPNWHGWIRNGICEP